MAGSPLKRKLKAAIETMTVETMMEHIANGMRLNDLCVALGFTPENRPWINTYLLKHHKDEYREARKRSADVLVEDSVEIADAATDKTFKRDKLRIETRQWLAGRLNREDYGEAQPKTLVNIDMGGIFAAALEQANKPQNQQIVEISESKVRELPDEDGLSICPYCGIGSSDEVSMRVHSLGCPLKPAS